MSDAYLQQCGEDAVDRTSFSFTWSMDDTGAVTVTGDAVEYSGTAMLDRAMLPGWWEVIGDFSIGSEIGRRGDVWWFDESEFDFDAPSWNTSAASGTPNVMYYRVLHFDNPKTDVGNNYMIVNPCARIAFALLVYGISNPPAGTSYTVTISGTFLACPNCPSPI